MSAGLKSGQDLSPSHEEAPKISFLNFLIVLAKHKKVVLGVPLLAALTALIVAFVLPKTYTATARVLPPQQKESSAVAMLGVLGGASGTAGATLGQALGLRNPNELYAAILKGQTIADRVILRFGLKELYEADTMVSTRKALQDATRILAGKDGLITIEVDDGDPRRAADMANAYVEELDTLMQSLAITEAAQRRFFFEKQLANVRNQLVAAELALRQSIDEKGIAGVDAQTRAVVSTAEQLRAQIAVKEIQLDAMRSFATERNPDAVRMRQEVASMKAELSRLEGGRKEGNGKPSPAGLENIRKLREVKFLEFTADLLTRQYEIARIDEANDGILIQVVDKAIAPDYKTKPKRLLIVILATLVFGILSVLYALVREAAEQASHDSDTSSKLEALRQSLRWR